MTNRVGEQKEMQVTVPPSPAALVTTAIKRAAVLFSGSTAVAILALLQNILVVRALGAEEYGVWGLGVSLAATAFGLLGFRTHDALNRSLIHVGADNNAGDTKAADIVTAALVVEFSAAAVTAVVLFALLPLIMPTLTTSALAPVAFMTNILMLLLMAQDKVFQGITRHADATRLIPTVNLIGAGLRMAAIATLFAFSQLNLETLAYSSLGVSLLTFAMHSYLLRQLLRSSLSLRLRDLEPLRVFARRRNLRDFWSMLGVTFWTSSASTIFKQADILLLGLWRDDQSVGLYRLAKSLALTLQNVGSSLAFSLYNDFSKLVKVGDLSVLRTALRRMNLIMSGVIPLAALGMLVAPHVVTLIYGAEFIAAVPALQSLIVASAAVIGFSWTFPLLISFGQEMTYLKIIVAGTTAQLLLSVIVLPATGGIMTMALISTGSWIGIYLAMLFMCLRHISYRTTRR